MRLREGCNGSNILALFLLLITAAPAAKIGSIVPVANAANNANDAHSLLRRRDQTTTATSPQLQFQLIDASTGRVVVDRLRNGMTVSLASLGLPASSPSLNIVAVPPEDDGGAVVVAAVRFSNDRREGSRPFAYCGDVGAGRAYNACDDLQRLGVHEITGIAIGADGAPLGRTTVTFSIFADSEEEQEPPASGGGGGGDELDIAFRLVHVPTKRVVADLEQGSVVDLQKLGIQTPSFSIEAVTSEQVTALKFSNDHGEGAAPFYYCGDRAGSEIFVCDDLVVGSHTVSAKIFGEGGAGLGTYSLKFDIVNGQQEVGNKPATEIGSLAKGAWVEVDDAAPLAARHEGCFVFDGVTRRAYLIGGRDRGNSYSVDIYDPETRSWSEGKEPPIELHHMNCVAVDGKIWIVSAWTGDFPRESNVADIYIYDPASDSWSTRDGLPEPRRRGAAAAVLVGRRIYVSHGNRGGHETGTFAQSLAWLDYYDIDADQWTTGLPDAPNPRDHTGGALLNGNKICIAGGRDGGEIGFFNLVILPTDCYDLSTGTWSEEADIPQGRAGSAYGTTCDGSQMIVAGGEGFGKAFSQVDVFDGTSWSTIERLNEARHGTGLAVDCDCNQQIHIASGSGGQGGGPKLNSVETFFLEGTDTQCAV